MCLLPTISAKSIRQLSLLNNLIAKQDKTQLMEHMFCELSRQVVAIKGGTGRQMLWGPHSGFPCVSFKFENDMPENTYKPKKFKLYTTFGGFKPLPRLSGIFGHYFHFCRLFLPSYLINPRTQNHSFPSWAIEGSKVCYTKKLTFGELLKT